MRPTVETISHSNPAKFVKKLSESRIAKTVGIIGATATLVAAVKDRQTSKLLDQQSFKLAKERGSAALRGYNKGTEITRTRILERLEGDIVSMHHENPIYRVNSFMNGPIDFHSVGHLLKSVGVSNLYDLVDFLDTYSTLVKHPDDKYEAERLRRADIAISYFPVTLINNARADTYSLSWLSDIHQATIWAAHEFGNKPRRLPTDLLLR
jgi:hypothetical protein